MNQNDIQRSFCLLDYDSNEIRVIHPNRTFIPSQFIHSYSDLLPICQEHDGQANIYIGINERTKINATKRDIRAVNFVVVDVDSVRPDKNQPANQQELDATIEVSKVILDWFADNDFCRPIRAMSGNGCHIWARIPRLPLTSLETTEQWESKVKQLYQQIKSILPDGLKQKVWIDSIQDVTRIMKLIGTTSVKPNQAPPERENRVSSWLDDPESLKDDVELFDYLQSITPEVSIKSDPTLHLGSDELDAGEQKILNNAMSSYHVQKARMEMDLNDRSVADYALAKELVREGVGDPKILKHALMTTPDTKYQRDGDESYVDRTISKLLNSLPGLPLLDARVELQTEFESIETEEDGLTLCQAPIATGKSFCARELVLNQAQKDESVLVTVPDHNVAQEWENKLIKEKDSSSDLSIVRLYGLSNDAIDCPYQKAKGEKKAKKLIKYGHTRVFRDLFCSFCSKQNSCLYYQGHQQAESADILIAQHSHAHNNPNFYGQVSNGNQNRHLVVIDEMPELKRCVPISRKSIKQNLKVLEEIKSETYYDFCCDLMIQTLDGMLNSLNKEADYLLNQWTINQLLGMETFWKELTGLKFEVSDYYKDKNRIPTSKNLIWDLEHILRYSLPLSYCDLKEKQYQDCLVYRWKPYLKNKRTLILSATTKPEYLKVQGFSVDQNIGKDLEVQYQNLKVVQLLEGNGGKTSMLNSIEDQSFAKRHGKLFELMLRKHEGEPFALVATKGEEGEDKELIINALSPIAKKYGRTFEPVNNEQLKTSSIPNGKDQIPIFHYGLSGINNLEGMYSVIWFMHAYYYHPTTIIDEVFKKHGRKIDKAEKAGEIFQELISSTSTKEYEVYRYSEDIGNLELTHGSEADMKQMEGRFLREDSIFKTIYRTHSVNIKPLPNRLYTSWKDLFFKEFHQVITGDEFLQEFSPKETAKKGCRKQEIWQWIRDNAMDKSFTSKDILQKIKIDKKNMRNKYLNEFEKGGYLDSEIQGQTKHFKLKDWIKMLLDR